MENNFAFYLFGDRWLEDPQFLQRECALDDAFPHLSKDLPGYYAAHFIWAAPPDHNSCGRPGCQGQRVLLPIDPQQNHICVQTRGIERSSRIYNGPSWSDPFCCMGEDLKGMHSNSACTLWILQPQTDISYHMLGIHQPSHYLLPRLKCQSCGWRDAYWV